MPYITHKHIMHNTQNILFYISIVFSQNSEILKLYLIRYQYAIRY